MDVVDEADRVVGRVPRGEIRRANLRHRSVFILVFDRRGRLLVHRRTPLKDVYPGLWDVAVGGVVASGESYADAARRELQEELGIVDAPLTHCFRFVYEDAANKLNGAVYRAEFDGPLRLQEEEIAAVEWIAPASMRELQRRRSFCPDGLVVWRRYCESASDSGN